MDYKKAVRLPHFIRGESVPNIQKIIEVLKNTWLIDQTIIPDKWMIDIDKIKQTLKNWDYRGIELNFLIQLKLTTEDLSATIDDDLLSILDNNTKELFKNIILKTSLMKQTSWQVITDALSINKHLLPIDQTIDLKIIWLSSIDNLWIILKKIKDLNQRNERMSNRLRMVENRRYRLNTIDERNIRTNYEEEKREIELEINQIISERERQIKNVIEFNKSIGFLEISNQVDSLYKKDTIEIWILADVFVPSFYQRINIIETWAVKKNELLEVLTTSKDAKEKLATKFLNISIGLICSALFINSISYICNYQNSLSIHEFIKLFLWHSFHFFIIEVILISSAIISFFQFRMYSKIVEIYDTYIFIVNSDSSYKDDDHFHMDDMEWQRRLFEMRKENTQKIHTLPEKTYSLLCWWKISDDLPQAKALEELIWLIKKNKE